MRAGRCTRRRAVSHTTPKGGEAMWITLHIGPFTVTIIVKSRNRHPARRRFLWLSPYKLSTNPGQPLAAAPFYALIIPPRPTPVKPALAFCRNLWYFKDGAAQTAGGWPHHPRGGVAHADYNTYRIFHGHGHCKTQKPPPWPVTVSVALAI